MLCPGDARNAGPLRWRCFACAISPSESPTTIDPMTPTIVGMPERIHRVTIFAQNLTRSTNVMNNHRTAPTQYLETEASRFAFRRFGNAARERIVLLQHFTGGMDHWDPILTDGLAEEREVILVDIPGIGGSTGTTPRTIEGMAAAILHFANGIGPRQV